MREHEYWLVNGRNSPSPRGMMGGATSSVGVGWSAVVFEPGSGARSNGGSPSTSGVTDANGVGDSEPRLTGSEPRSGPLETPAVAAASGDTRAPGAIDTSAFVDGTVDAAADGTAAGARSGDGFTVAAGAATMDGLAAITDGAGTVDFAGTGFTDGAGAASTGVPRRFCFNSRS